MENTPKIKITITPVGKDPDGVEKYVATITMKCEELMMTRSLGPVDGFNIPIIVDGGVEDVKEMCETFKDLKKKYDVEVIEQ